MSEIVESEVSFQEINKSAVVPEDICVEIFNRILDFRLVTREELKKMLTRLPADKDDLVAKEILYMFSKNSSKPLTELYRTAKFTLNIEDDQVGDLLEQVRLNPFFKDFVLAIENFNGSSLINLYDRRIQVVFDLDSKIKTLRLNTRHLLNQLQGESQKKIFSLFFEQRIPIPITHLIQYMSRFSLSQIIQNLNPRLQNRGMKIIERNGYFFLAPDAKESDILIDCSVESLLEYKKSVIEVIPEKLQKKKSREGLCGKRD